jgi:hypothetical protein
MVETLEAAIPSFNRSLPVESRAGRLTDDPGVVVLLREVLERSGIVSWMTARLDAFGCNEVRRLGRGRQPADGGPSGRRMANGGNLLAYGLYHDYARTSEWGIAPRVATGTGTGGQQSLTVFGAIFPGQRPPVGIYTGSVVVTVTS